MSGGPVRISRALSFQSVVPTYPIRPTTGIAPQDSKQLWGLGRIMPDPVERLARVCASRVHPGHGQWLAFERDYGIVFPRQYKNLIDEFAGTSSWWNDSLHVLSPSHGGQYALRKNLDAILRADRESRSAWPQCYPLPLFPEEGGLFPWAVSDYATLYWITRCGSDFGPDDWPTLIRPLRSFEFEVHFEPTALILYLIAKGQLRSMVIPPE
jgi:hypothetical protein